MLPHSPCRARRSVRTWPSSTLFATWVDGHIGIHRAGARSNHGRKQPVGVWETPDRGGPGGSSGGGGNAAPSGVQSCGLRTRGQCPSPGCWPSIHFAFGCPRCRSHAIPRVLAPSCALCVCPLRSFFPEAVSCLDPEHLHHFVAQVVDDLDGDAAGGRFVEGA